MHKALNWCLTALACASMVNVNAQEFYQPDTSVKVFAYSKQLSIPWAGGFNNPQFAAADLNRDGRQDLVVFERNLGVKTFLNIGTSDGLPMYRYEPRFALTFPPVNSYIYMLDYNCDGIPDLFERGWDGIGVHKGYYNASNQLCFTFYRSLFYYNDATAGGPSNAYVNPGDIPGIADVDGDGDIDFVSYYITGGYMYYHRNMRVEDNLPCDSIRIKLADRCWGKVYQNFDRAHQLGYSCDNGGLGPKPAPIRGRRTHAGNTICLFDWDKDGDVEYLDGNVSFNEMTFIKNTKLEYGWAIDTLTEQDTLWQTGGKRIEIPTWPAAFYIDVNQDGNKDLLVAPNGGAGSENYNCIWYYKSATTPGAPSWTYMSDSFLVDNTIDVGTATYPLLFDYDKDGKLDLLVGSDGYRQPDGQLRATMSLYKNTTTSSDNASFTLVTKNLININTYAFKGTAPAAGDIDNDGKSDLVVGHTSGLLSYFKNMAASETVQPDWQLEQMDLKDENGNNINVGGYAAPFIYDVDKDGKKDLLIGSIFGYVQYYRNVATTPGAIKLKLINTRLGTAKADPTQPFGNYSTPFVGKIDPSNEDYLLLGSNSGNIYQYKGIATGDTTIDYTLTDAHYAYIDSTYNRYNSAAYGIYSNHRTTVTVGDIDGSGSYVLIKGNIKGGLEIYKRKVYTGQVPVDADKVKLVIYPNPANNAVNVAWQGINDTEIKEIQVSVIDITGRECMQKVAPTMYGLTQFSTGHLPQGMYVCIIKAGNSRHYGKFTIVR